MNNRFNYSSNKDRLFIAKCYAQDQFPFFSRYWYNNGNIFPNMGTVWIALDKTTKDNGCVQVHNAHSLKKE